MLLESNFSYNELWIVMNTFFFNDIIEFTS